MSTSSADAAEAPASAPGATPLNAGDFMDLDAAAACWPFDPIAAFRSSPPHRLLLPASPSWIFPELDLSHPPSPPLSVKERILPASPSWIFSDHVDLSHPQPPPLSVKERMSRALRNFKDSTSQHVLVQIWAPVRTGDRYVLSTSGQPFVIDPQSSRLLQYRMVSSSYVFELEGDGERDAGIPGRVFRHRLPEWTPNVQYYSSKEYPRLVHALRYDVQGTLALPVFENMGRDCVGVVEMVMTSPMINYATEVDMVCKALEAVNLKSSETLDHPNGLICNDGREAALAEVLEILTVVCEAHKLPLAQTWVPCRHRSILAQGGGLKKSCSSFDGSCMGQVCMSTTDVAFYVIDPRMWGFRDACVEHHLQNGQGVAGRAFESRRACFCADVTQFCKTEYPLVHYARMFGLASCLAICLQSTQSGNDNYILEFFLPPQCKDTTDQQTLLDSISSVMKQCSRSLKFVSSIGLEGESLEIIDVLANENFGLNPKAIISCSRDTWDETYPVIYPGSRDDSKIEGNAITDLQEQRVEQDINPEKDGLTASCPTLDEGGKNNVIHQRRGKAEKSISLEVLQQYFTGSLKDAAKSLGVCPTTMKRICRQHGISRWPSRKINKVNRSLSKLQQVLESVQGSDGPLKLTSLTGTIPVSGGSICWPVTMVGPMQSQGSPRVPRKIHENGLSVVAVQRDPVHYLISSQLEADKESDGSKTRSSSEGSLETPSQDSCQGSPAQEIHSDNTPGLQTDGKSCESLGLTSQLLGVSNIPAAVSEDIAAAPVWLLSRMLVEDSGSSKDLRDLCDNVEGGCPDDPAIDSCQNPTQPVDSRKPTTVTIKACYKGDIIRFRMPCNAGVLALSDEVAKRLNLEAGMFDIRYLDEDKEWVILACDADLEECIEVSRLSGAYVTRFTVDDIAANLGSSYGSSVE